MRTWCVGGLGRISSRDNSTGEALRKEGIWHIWETDEVCVLGEWWMKIRPGGCDPGEQGFQWEDHTGPPRSWEGTKIDPMLEAIHVEEFLQIFFHLWTHFIQLSPPHSFTITYRSDLCHEWETEGVEFSLREAKTSPGWGCSLILLWPLLIFLPPQCLLCFQAYLPLTFWITLLDAFYQSLVCFFVPYYVSPCSLKGFVVNE